MCGGDFSGVLGCASSEFPAASAGAGAAAVTPLPGPHSEAVFCNADKPELLDSSCTDETLVSSFLHIHIYNVKGPTGTPPKEQGTVCDQRQARSGVAKSEIQRSAGPWPFLSMIVKYCRPLVRTLPPSLHRLSRKHSREVDPCHA